MRRLAELLGERWGAAAGVPGRQGPFGRTRWEDDLAASRAVLGEAGARAAAALDAGARPVTLASDCSLALGTLPALARAAPDARVLWLDAHSDFDTPETSTIGFLGCMSLAGACGAWESGLGALDPARVVLCGARARPGDFDAAGQREAEASAMTVVPLGPDAEDRVAGALGDAPVYVHLDPDVLDPSVNPVPYGRPGGLSAEGLSSLLARVASRGPVAGLELTAFHTSDEPAQREALAALLAGLVSLTAG